MKVKKTLGVFSIVKLIYLLISGLKHVFLVLPVNLPEVEVNCTG